MAKDSPGQNAVWSQLWAWTDLDGLAAVDRQWRHRVLVQKFLYDLRRPRRWEVSVFHFPGDPSQAYVKRVVGLPGESIQIDRGDIVVNGKIARKTLKEQRATRVLVFDNNFVPRDADTRYGSDVPPRPVRPYIAQRLEP